MYYHHPNKVELDTLQLSQLSNQFTAIQSTEQLARLMGVTASTLEKLAQKQEYIRFSIPKPGGQKRLIQHPATALKTVQQNLNRYLQAVYFGVKTPCAYGFISVPKDELYPRNIYANALRHINGEWFLNIDLKDFFHTITVTHLKDLFRQVFNFSAELTGLLTRLCTCEGRLPMGAPTSPVLSNFACLFFDFQLMKLAEDQGCTFTRYADDLTFSFNTPPPAEFMESVKVIVLRHGFVLNEAKIRLQSRIEQPEITGLVIGRGPQPVISKNWLKRLKQEIGVYRWLMTEAVRERGLFHAYVFDRFRESVTGQVAFVGFVMGKDSRAYRKLVGKLG